MLTTQSHVCSKSQSGFAYLRRHTGAVDQDVHPAEALDGLRDYALGISFVGHVARQSQPLPARLLDQ